MSSMSYLQIVGLLSQFWNDFFLFQPVERQIHTVHQAWDSAPHNRWIQVPLLREQALSLWTRRLEGASHVQ